MLTGRDRALLSNQFGGIACSKFVLLSWGLAVAVLSHFPGARDLNSGCGRIKLVKFRLSDSHACQSVCIYRADRIDHSPDSDNYRCGLFHTTAVLSISVIMGCGGGRVLL